MMLWSVLHGSKVNVIFAHAPGEGVIGIGQS